MFAQLLVLLQSMQQRWHANGSPGTYVWDIPDWYQTYTYSINGTTANFMQWVLQNVDIPNVLDFQSDGADMISRAQPTMAYAKQLGIPISAAIETTDVGDDQISFYGQSMQQLQETLIQVNSQWTSEYPTFRGFLLHDLVGLQGMSTNGSSFQSQMLPVNVYVYGLFFLFIYFKHYHYVGGSTGWPGQTTPPSASRCGLSSSRFHSK